MGLSELMQTDGWYIFIGIARALTFVGILFIIIYLVKEIETAKMLGSACEICMNKTGAICIMPGGIG